MSGTERLFVAQELALEFRNTLRERVSLPSGWRPTPPVNWHLTLFFVGSLPLNAWQERSEALAHVAAGHAAFTLERGDLQVVEGRDRMTWLRFSPHPAFDALHADLAQAFRLPPDPRSPHWPHITLARAGRNAPSPSARQALPGSLVVDSLTLFRSEPGDGHPRYVPLARYPLQNSSS